MLDLIQTEPRSGVGVTALSQRDRFNGGLNSEEWLAVYQALTNPVGDLQILTEIIKMIVSTSLQQMGLMIC